MTRREFFEYEYFWGCMEIAFREMTPSACWRTHGDKPTSVFEFKNLYWEGEEE